MDGTQWTEREVDQVRLRRLAVGMMLSTALLSGAVALAASGSSGGEQPGDGALDVVFAELPHEEPEAPAEEPPPEEPPPRASAPHLDRPTAAAPLPLKAGPKAVDLVPPPDKVPDRKAHEAAVDPSQMGPRDDPNRDPGGGGTARVGSTAPPVPKPVRPPPPGPPRKKKRRVKKPRRITEGMTPPTRVGGGAPGYPAAAKSQGIEGTVVVTFVVTETGSVTSARAVRGPAALRGVCVAAVQGWRFKPARDAQGRVVAARRIAKFPFRIRTK